MKATIAVAAFVGLIGRCSGPDWPDPLDGAWHADHDVPPEASSDAAVPDAEPDAGVSDVDQPDAALPPAAAEDDAAVDAACSGPPGLYADDACEQLADGVSSYTPKFPLWTDGADKQRYIYLPAGAPIDTTNPDRWAFPVGTRVYKTFSLQGKKLETRVFEKLAEPPGIGSWSFVSYLWSDDQRSVSLADAEGVQDVLGTDHDIPSQAQCRSCHNQSGLDIVNGFGALQLDHGGQGWTLRRLLDHDRLVNLGGDAPNVTLDSARLPGDDVDHAALGYLHANCGHCHGGPSPRVGLDLSLRVGLPAVDAAPISMAGASCACLKRWTGRANDSGDVYAFAVLPGAAAQSGIIGRMSVRGAGEQMPPLGTEHVDADAVAAVSQWIDRLTPVSCDPQLCVTPPAPQ